MSTIKFCNKPPADETEAEKQLRFFTNGMYCGIHDKQNELGRCDNSPAAWSYQEGYKIGYNVTLSPTEVSNRCVNDARRYVDSLPDVPKNERPTFYGATIDKFNLQQIDKILFFLYKTSGGSFR